MTGSMCFTNIRKLHNSPLGWKGTFIIAILHLGNMLHMLESHLSWISFHDRTKKEKENFHDAESKGNQRRQRQEILKPLSEAQ